MSDTTSSLTRKISSAGDLQSVVRTMKALAASSIGQYEKSVLALADYYRTVELGLGACFRESEPAASMVERKRQTDAGAIGARATKVWQAVGLGGLQAVDDLRQHQRQRVLACPARPGQDQRLGEALRANALAQMGDGRRVA